MVVSERNHSVPSVLIDGLLEILQSRVEQSSSFFCESHVCCSFCKWLYKSRSQSTLDGYSVNIQSNSSVNEERKWIGAIIEQIRDGADGGK